MILIVANGDVDNLEWLAKLATEAQVVMAADGGLRYLAAVNQRPDIIVGDLDSVDEEMLTVMGDGPETILHPADKDATDLELALLVAAERYDEPVTVVGAFGGRIDQTLANLTLLAHPDLRDRAVRLATPRQSVWLVEGASQIDGRPGDLVSLLPLGDEVVVERTLGLKWPLENERLGAGSSRGISNEIVETPAAVVVGAGRLLCVLTAGEWGR